MLKITFKQQLIFLCVLIASGCGYWEQEEDVCGNLIVDKVSFSENDNFISCSLPDGAYVPDNLNFEFNDCDTYTGNMAQYVKHHYGYEINFKVTNTGNGVAYDTEIYLHYFYSNGDAEVHTIFVGDIYPNKSILKSIQIYSTDTKLEEVSAEAFLV